MALEQIDRENYKLKIILGDKRVCHNVYLGQIALIVILIFSISCFVIFASYSAIIALFHSDTKQGIEYLKLLSLISSSYLGYVILKLLQYLSNTSTKYLTELSKFNSQIMRIK